MALADQTKQGHKVIGDLIGQNYKETQLIRAYIQSCENQRKINIQGD